MNCAAVPTLVWPPLPSIPPMLLELLLLHKYNPFFCSPRRHSLPGRAHPTPFLSFLNIPWLPPQISPHLLLQSPSHSHHSQITHPSQYTTYPAHPPTSPSSKPTSSTILRHLLSILFTLRSSHTMHLHPHGLFCCIQILHILLNPKSQFSPSFIHRPLVISHFAASIFLASSFKIQTVDHDIIQSQTSIF